MYMEHAFKALSKRRRVDHVWLTCVKTDLNIILSDEWEVWERVELMSTESKDLFKITICFNHFHNFLIKSQFLYFNIIVYRLIKLPHVELMIRNDQNVSSSCSHISVSAHQWAQLLSREDLDCPPGGDWRHCYPRPVNMFSGTCHWSHTLQTKRWISDQLHTSHLIAETRKKKHRFLSILCILCTSMTPSAPTLQL